MIVIVDYGIGNLGSITNMLRRIGYDSVISKKEEEIAAAEKIILPGVGAFDQAVNNIHELNLWDVIKQKAMSDQTPLLGICLGMQLLLDRSEEGNGQGFGFIKGYAAKFNFSDEQREFKVPHMGWNNVMPVSPIHPLLRNSEHNMRFYFVHSYYASCENNENIIGTTNYGFKFASAIAHNNIMGVQFHPEKSHLFGITLLKNFCGI